MAKGECEREQFMAEIEWAVRELVQILQTHKMPFLDLSGVKQAQTFVCPCCSGSLKPLQNPKINLNLVIPANAGIQ